MAKQMVKAPAGKFRLISIDLSDCEVWQEGDFIWLDKAKRHADEKAKGKLVLLQIYDDEGRQLYNAATS